MGSKRVHFTPAEDARIAELRAKGFGDVVIGRDLGRSPSSIRNRLRYLSGANYADGRTCGDCAKPIRNDAKGTFCRSCGTARANREPAMKAKRVEGWKRRLTDPLKYAQVCRVAAANSRKAMTDPEKRKAAQERAMANYHRYFRSEEFRELLRSPEYRRRVSERVREQRMGWCPKEYRELYYELRRKLPGSAKIARDAVLDQIAADKRKALASLSPFERQQRALERGASLVANDTAPTLHNPANYGEERWTYGR